MPYLLPLPLPRLRAAARKARTGKPKAVGLDQQLRKPEQVMNRSRRGEGTPIVYRHF